MSLSVSCLYRLSYCKITTQGCITLASQFLPRLPHLKVLDLSENSLRQTGIQRLATYLKNPECKLEILRSVCLLVTCRSRLGFRTSWMIMLGLGLMWVTFVVETPTPSLKDCRVTPEASKALALALILNPSHLKELDLHWNNPGDDPGVEQLAALMKDPRSKLEVLWLEFSFYVYKAKLLEKPLPDP